MRPQFVVRRVQYEGRAVRVTLARRLRGRAEQRARMGMLARLAVESGFDYVEFKHSDHLYLAVRHGAPARPPPFRSDPIRSDLTCASRSAAISSEVRHIYSSFVCVLLCAEATSTQEQPKEGCFTYDSNVLVLPASTTSSSSSPSSTAAPAATVIASPKQMRELQLGDQVLAYDVAAGRPTYSPVIAWLHRDTEHEFEFVRLEFEHTAAQGDAAAGKRSQLELTAEHLVFTLEQSCSEKLVAKFAGDVRPGDLFLRQSDDQPMRSLNSSCPSAVARVVTVERRRVRRGAYAPLTAAGTLVVDGVVVSCYAAFANARVAHAAFAPYRALVRVGEMASWAIEHWPLGAGPKVDAAIGPRNESTEALHSASRGVHWYAQMLIHVLHFLDRFVDYQSITSR